MAKHMGARVVWISSHEASSKFYDSKDWQLVKSEHSYQCSKYQMNMMSIYLDREAIRRQLDGAPAVRHFTVYPGVAGTSIASALLGTFMSLCMYATFYIVSSVKYPAVHLLSESCQARLLGSPNHPIDVFKAAISAVYSSLTPFTCLLSVNGTPSSTDSKEPVNVGTVYMSKTDWWGREFVGMATLVQSQEEEAQTKELLENCDRLLKTLCDVQGRASPQHVARTGRCEMELDSEGSGDED